jgi:hypothetical protein
MSVVEVPADAAGKLARAGAPVARAEGFPLHALSMEARTGEIPAMRENGGSDEHTG